MTLPNFASAPCDWGGAPGMTLAFCDWYNININNKMHSRHFVCQMGDQFTLKRIEMKGIATTDLFDNRLGHQWCNNCFHIVGDEWHFF